MKDKREITLQTGLFPKVISLKLFSECTRSEISGGIENKNPVSSSLLMFVAQAPKQRIFATTYNIHATRVVTLSAEELGTMSKNNLQQGRYGELSFIFSCVGDITHCKGKKF